MKIINKKSGDTILEVFGRDEKTALEMAKSILLDLNLTEEEVELEVIMTNNEKFELGVKEAEKLYPQIDRFIDFSMDKYLRVKLNNIENLDKLINDGMVSFDNGKLSDYLNTIDEGIRGDIENLIKCNLKFRWVYLNKINYDKAFKEQTDFNIVEFPKFEGE